MPRIIPVIDIMNRRVVRATGGNRSNYQPLQSKLTNSTDPVIVTKCLVKEFMPSELYVADLDGIQKGSTNLNILEEMAAAGIPLWIDAGIRTHTDALPIAKIPNSLVIVGSESLQSVNELADSVAKVGSHKIVFSLDLREGAVIGNPIGWEMKIGSDNQKKLMIKMIDRVAKLNITKIIVLDLAQVGSGEGLTTAALCQLLKDRYPQLEIITGGGIRNPTDLTGLDRSGISGVLIGTALHDKLFP